MVNQPINFEIHALLWHGEIADAPTDMREWINRLADNINPDAINSDRGAWTTAV